MKGNRAVRGWKVIVMACLAAVAGMPEMVRAEEATRLDPIVVTATRIEQKVSEQAASVSVVTKEEFDLLGPVMAGDAMNGLPGVVVQRSGSAGGLENIRIRGGKGAHTLVLIDGFPVNSPTLGEYDIGSLPLNGFDRIEVVRGAQSALYGSNAMAGVVNFVPRKGEEGNRPEAGLTAGSFGSLGAHGSLQGSGKGRSFYLGGEGFRTDGIMASDAMNLASFVGTGDLAIGERIRLHALGLSVSQDKEIPVDYFKFGDVNHRNFRRGQMVAGRLETRVTKALALLAYGSLFDERFDVNDPADPGETYGFKSVTKTRKSTVGLRATFAPSPVSTTFIGAEYMKDHGTNRYDFDSTAPPPFSGSGTSFVAETIHNGSVYIQEELHPSENTGISLGARLDMNSVVGNRLHPKVAAYYFARGLGTRFRAAFGTGFRTPTILEKTDPYFGNISLTSERAASFEAGVDVRLPGGKGMFSATCFYQDFRDMIEYDNRFTFQLVNADALARGIEAGLSLRFLPKVEFTLAYTWSDSWDGTLQQRILGVPEHRGQVAFLFDPTPAWQARVGWRIESDQLDAALYSGRTRRPGFVVMDASTRYILKIRGTGMREVALTGKVRNLLDHRYEERLDNPSPGINFLLGAELKI